MPSQRPSQWPEFLDRARFLHFSKGDAAFVKIKYPGMISVSGSSSDTWRQLAGLPLSPFFLGPPLPVPTNTSPDCPPVLVTSFKPLLI